jgi:hypothetical protein
MRFFFTLILPILSVYRIPSSDIGSIKEKLDNSTERMHTLSKALMLFLTYVLVIPIVILLDILRIAILLPFAILL